MFARCMFSHIDAFFSTPNASTISLSSSSSSAAAAAPLRVHGLEVLLKMCAGGRVALLSARRLHAVSMPAVATVG
jgi:hypothetical protein